MDTLILLVIIVVLGSIALKQYKPDTYDSIKNKVLSLVKRK